MVELDSRQDIIVASSAEILLGLTALLNNLASSVGFEQVDADGGLTGGKPIDGGAVIPGKVKELPTSSGLIVLSIT